MFEQQQRRLEGQIRALLEEAGVPLPEHLNFTDLPFKGTWGFALPMFPLAAAERRSGKPVKVPQRAQELAEYVAQHLQLPEGFQRVEAVRGYLNIYLDPGYFSRFVVDRVLEEGPRYGHHPPRGQRVMVEFSQPNTHKALHVGHLRGTILGDVVARMLQAAGYEVIRANYLGDIGLHVIKWLWNYIKFHNGEEPPPGVDKARWVSDLYVEANKRLEEHPEWEAEVRELFLRWDRGDPDLRALWEKTRQWSLEGFEHIYRTLNITFDRVYYESEVEESGKRFVQELIEKGIAQDQRPDGPVVVDLDRLLGLEETYRAFVVLRSDGTSLYSTKDLALAVQKFQEYPDLARSIYVVDIRQSLYLQQIFKTLEVAGYPWADRLYHLAYEVVTLPGNVVLKTREGEVIFLDELIREAIQRARQIVEEKNPALDPETKERVARAVALGSLKYTMLARENNRKVVFTWEKALSFEGVAAPYIQYAHVRARSILRKAGDQVPQALTPTHTLHPAEVELISQIARLPEKVLQAAEAYRPLTLTTHAYEMARAFNDFYKECPVLQAEPPVRDFRLRLVAAARQALANTLALLNIEAPDVM